MKIVQITTDTRDHYRTYGEPTPYFGAAPQALLQGFASIPDLQVHVVSCVRRPLPSPEKIGPNLWYHSLPVPRVGWLWTGYQGCIRAVRRKLASLQPDLVHGQGTERDCALDAVFSGFPNVLTLHGNMADVARVLRAPLGSFHWLAARLETLALHRTGGVLCNSAFTEQLARSRSRRQWRVANPVRQTFFAPATEEPDRSRCVILNAGVICEYKRQLDALDIARRLHHEGVPIQMRFLGPLPHGSPYADTFRERIQIAEQAGYATYLGFKDPEALRNEYDRAAALLHIPTTESFGLVVAEALARNVKLFATRTGGVPDIAEGVQDAELFNDGDWDGLFAAVVRWFRAGWPRSQHGAHLMRSRYHPEIIARRHLEIYREVLSSDS
jgi:glycosyltransferase involved in cell wall biosynthesis